MIDFMVCRKSEIPPKIPPNFKAGVVFGGRVSI